MENLIDTINTVEQIDQFICKLRQKRLSLVEASSKKLDIVTCAKQFVLEYVNDFEKYKDKKISVLMKDALGKEYQYISRVFKRETETTIWSLVIKERLERVKQLLEDNELSVDKIAFKVGYSSVPHLSTQFKRFLGLTLREYRNLKAFKHEEVV